MQLLAPRRLPNCPQRRLAPAQKLVAQCGLQALCHLAKLEIAVVRLAVGTLKPCLLFRCQLQECLSRPRVEGDPLVRVQVARCVEWVVASGEALEQGPESPQEGVANLLNAGALLPIVAWWRVGEHAHVSKTINAKGLADNLLGAIRAEQHVASHGAGNRRETYGCTVAQCPGLEAQELDKCRPRLGLGHIECGHPDTPPKEHVLLRRGRIPRAKDDASLAECPLRLLRRLGSLFARLHLLPGRRPDDDRPLLFHRTNRRLVAKALVEVEVVSHHVPHKPVTHLNPQLRHVCVLHHLGSEWVAQRGFESRTELGRVFLTRPRL